LLWLTDLVGTAGSFVWCWGAGVLGCWGEWVLVVDGLGSMVAYQAQHPSHSGFMVFFAVQSSGIPPVLLTGGADTKLPKQSQ
jgi:hypothetical protein